MMYAGRRRCEWGGRGHAYTHPHTHTRAAVHDAATPRLGVLRLGRRGQDRRAVRDGRGAVGQDGREDGPHGVGGLLAREVDLHVAVLQHRVGELILRAEEGEHREEERHVADAVARRQVLLLDAEELNTPSVATKRGATDRQTDRQTSQTDKTGARDRWLRSPL